MARKDYDQAIAEYDSVEPDGLLLGEKGYALLRLGRNDEAIGYLDRALKYQGSDDSLAQIWFNRGVAERARGREDQAVLSFYRSQRLRPSAAAQTALAGKTRCPLVVKRVRDAARPYDTWASWSGAVTGDVETSDQDAKNVACSGCEGSGPWKGEAANHEVHVLASRGAGLWDYGAVGVAWFGPQQCVPTEDIAEGQIGNFIFTRVIRMEPRAIAVLDGPLAPLRDCLNDHVPDAQEPPGPWIPAPPGCQIACVADGATERYSIFDTLRHVQVLKVSQEIWFPLQTPPGELPFDVVVTPAPTQLEVSGGVCPPIPYEAP